MGLSVRRDCECGHDKGTHEHYRRGTDCSGCSCQRFHGQLEVTVRFGRARSLTSVVLPDEVPTTQEPWVRPTHSAGLTTYPPQPPAPRAAEAPPTRVTRVDAG